MQQKVTSAATLAWTPPPITARARARRPPPADADTRRQLLKPSKAQNPENGTWCDVRARGRKRKKTGGVAADEDAAGAADEDAAGATGAAGAVGRAGSHSASEEPPEDLRNTQTPRAVGLSALTLQAGGAALGAGGEGPLGFA